MSIKLQVIFFSLISISSFLQLKSLDVAIDTKPDTFLQHKKPVFFPENYNHVKAIPVKAEKDNSSLPLILPGAKEEDNTIYANTPTYYQPRQIVEEKPKINYGLFFFIFLIVILFYFSFKDIFFSGKNAKIKEAENPIDILEHLKKLEELKKKGTISEEEFIHIKKKILKI
jgi:hypothetical protein